MAEVALSDYIAYIFQELSRARDLADRYSREVALAYAKDDVLRHFSVPRFKIAKMDLNMPVLVSGVQVSSLMKFRMNHADFKRAVINLLIEIFAPVPAIIRRPNVLRTDGVEPIVDRFHDQLLANPDPSRPDDIVQRNWTAIFQHVCTANGIPAELIQRLAGELLTRAVNALLTLVKGQTSASRATLESLLVNPETNVVKNGSSDASVFTIKAELMEEGLFVRSVKDEATGTQTQVVEFE